MKDVRKIVEFGLADSIKQTFGSIDSFLGNPYVLAGLLTLLFVGTAALNKKKQTYYGKEKEKFENHSLNRKYHFNEKKRLDVDLINKYYMYLHIACAFLCGLTICLAAILKVSNEIALCLGMGVFILSTIGGNFFLIDYLGKKFEKLK